MIKLAILLSALFVIGCGDDNDQGDSMQPTCSAPDGGMIRSDGGACVVSCGAGLQLCRQACVPNGTCH